VAITRFKLLSYDGCKRTEIFRYLHAKTELFNFHHCKQCNCKFYYYKKNCCVYRDCKLLLIESCLFLEVSQKVEKQTVVLSITCLHIMSERKCKNAFLKFKSIVNHRQICNTSILVHKLTIYLFFLEFLLI